MTSYSVIIVRCQSTDRGGEVEEDVHAIRLPGKRSNCGDSVSGVELGGYIAQGTYRNRDDLNVAVGTVRRTGHHIIPKALCRRPMSYSDDIVQVSDPEVR